MIVHTNGDEEAVLRGAASTLEKVRAVTLPIWPLAKKLNATALLGGTRALRVAFLRFKKLLPGFNVTHTPTYDRLLAKSLTLF